MENYSRKRGELDVLPKLTEGLENTFNFKVSDYDLSLALPYLNSKIMMIHDEQDEEVPVSDVLSLKSTYENIVLQLTNGYGHQKNLVNRGVLTTIKDFLKG